MKHYTPGPWNVCFWESAQAELDDDETAFVLKAPQGDTTFAQAKADARAAIAKAEGATP